MEEFAEDEAIIAAGPSPQNSSDDSDESDDGRSDLSMSHYDSHIERLVGELENGEDPAARGDREERPGWRPGEGRVGVVGPRRP